MMKKFRTAALALALLALPGIALAATIQKWVAGAGVGFTWTNLCTTELNSLASNNALICSTSVSNQTALDTYANFSIAFGSVASGSGSPFISISIYPLNEDGSTYGDGLFGSAAAGPPAIQTCTIPVNPGVTAAIVGTGSCGQPIAIPPGTFKIVVWNNAGVALASSGNVVAYRTFNLQSQ